MPSRSAAPKREGTLASVRMVSTTRRRIVPPWRYDAASDTPRTGLRITPADAPVPVYDSVMSRSNDP
jgi:hypothetical protein